MGALTMPCFNLTQTFFGFKPEHQVQFHNQLFDLLWAGEGRWSFQDIYTMPLRIRKLWVSNINQMRTQETVLMEQQVNKSKSKIYRPPTKSS